MNRLLVDLLATFNILLAAAIVAGSTLGTAAFLDTLWGLPLGFIVGVGVAAIWCGLLSLLVLIEQHLRELADGIRPVTTKSAPATPAVSKTRIDAAARRVAAA